MSKHEDEAHDLIFPDAPSMASKPSDYDQCFYPVTGYRYGKIRPESKVSTACNGTRKYHADNPISFNHPFTGPPDTEGLREPSKVAWVLEDQDCPHEPLVDKDHPKGDVCRRCNNYIKKAQPDRELTDARGALLLVADKCVAYENALANLVEAVNYMLTYDRLDKQPLKAARKLLEEPA